MKLIILFVLLDMMQGILSYFGSMQLESKSCIIMLIWLIYWIWRQASMLLLSRGTLIKIREIFNRAHWFTTVISMIFWIMKKSWEAQQVQRDCFLFFSLFFSECNLYDFYESGYLFSYRGHRGIHFVSSRLCQAVANSLWAENYTTADY